MKNHCGTAIGADDKAGILVEFLHLGRTSPVLPHPLDDVPGLPADQGCVATLDDHAFLPGVLYLPSVLVGPGAVLHIEGVADVQLVLQHICHCVAVPVIRLVQEKANVLAAEPLVGVHGRA